MIELTNTYRKEVLISKRKNMYNQIESLLIQISTNQKKIDSLKEIYARIKAQKVDFDEKRNTHGSVLKKIGAYSSSLPFVQKLENQMTVYYKGNTYEMASSFMGSLLSNIDRTITKLDNDSFFFRKKANGVQDSINKINYEINLLNEKIRKGET